jgi:hypothetical protein
VKPNRNNAGENLRVALLGKLVVAGIVIGGAAYWYDASFAKTKIKDAFFVSSETDQRCRNNHESMCQYSATVMLKKENIRYTFRIPWSYYHSNETKLKTNDRVPVVVKAKMIFPERILDLAPKYKAKIDKRLAEEK